MVAGRRIDSSGSLVASTNEELRQNWQRLRAQRGSSPASPPRPGHASRDEARELFEKLEFTTEPPETLVAASPWFVDLSPFSSHSLTEAVGPVLRAWSLAALPRGRQTFNGIEFEIGAGVVQLANGVTESFAGQFPTNVSGIRIGRKARRLHFLYATHASDRDQLVARHVIRFRNAQAWEIPITGQFVDAARNSDSEPHRTRRALLAAVVPNQSRTVRLLQTSWENPLPNLEIEVIDLMSVRTWAAIRLVAITVE